MQCAQQQAETGDVVAALRSYQQADADGVMVLVARQACEDGAAEIERLRNEVASLHARIIESAATAQPPSPAKVRSVKQHKRQFAVFRAAFMHWPEDHEFQPYNEDHLRKYLIAKAPKHRSVEVTDTSNMPMEMAVVAITAQINKAGPYAFHRNKGSRFYTVTAHSIAFDELPHDEACNLFNEIAEVIYAEIGITVETLINETTRAA